MSGRRVRIWAAVSVVAVGLAVMVPPVPAARAAVQWYFGTIGAGGDTPASVIFAGQPHIFHTDHFGDDLLHSVWTGAAWITEVLDGVGGPNGRIDAQAGSTPTAMLVGGLPHVFYYDRTNGNLRHGAWSGTQWYFETLDGAGGLNGRVDADVGYKSSAIIYRGQPLIFHYDLTNGDLRHGVWDGSQWYFGYLDGAGGPNGRIDADVGLASSAVIYNGQPLVFYYDYTDGDLRHGVWDGSQWSFGYLDGAGGPNGRIGGYVGIRSSVVIYGGQPLVFYYDSTNGDLRHGVWDGSQWSFGYLDGAGGPNGRIDADVGFASSAVIYNGQPLVFYFDWTNHDLRHGVWDGSQWYFGYLDGSGGPNGRIDGDVGSTSSVVVYAGQLLVTYTSLNDGTLRDAVYG